MRRGRQKARQSGTHQRHGRRIDERGGCQATLATRQDAVVAPPPAHGLGKALSKPQQHALAPARRQFSPSAGESFPEVSPQVSRLASSHPPSCGTGPALVPVVLRRPSHWAGVLRLVLPSRTRVSERVAPGDSRGCTPKAPMQKCLLEFLSVCQENALRSRDFCGGLCWRGWVTTPRECLQ